MSDELDHLSDILRHATEARKYLEATSKEDFRADGMKRDSVNYKFIVIGEAANRLGPSFQKRHPAIPWSDIIGMRNVVAHQYGRVDPDIVWDAVKTKLPILVDYVAKIIGGSDNDDVGGPRSEAFDVSGGRDNKVPPEKGARRSAPTTTSKSKKADEWER